MGNRRNKTAAVLQFGVRRHKIDTELDLQFSPPADTNSAGDHGVPPDGGPDPRTCDHQLFVFDGQAL